jgi:hypothetical protein
VSNLYTIDATEAYGIRETSRSEIVAAVADRRAVGVWSHAEGHNVCRLLICRTREEADAAAERMDTRGECYSMWDETWTTIMDTVPAALAAAK